MEQPFLYPLALIIIIIIILTYLLTRSTQKHNNLPPSPPSIPIIGHLHLLKEPIHRTLQSISQNSGKLLFLRWGSRKILLVSSPSIAEECYTKHDILLAYRPRLLAGKLHYNYTTVALAPYGHLWHNLRRVMTLEILSSSRLATFTTVREGEVRLLLNKIMKENFAGKKIELKFKFSELSFNAMTMMVVGKRYYGEDVGDAGAAKSFGEAMREAVDLSGTTNIEDFLPVLQWRDMLGTEKRLDAMMAKMDKFLKGLVDDRRVILSSDENGVEKLMIYNLLSLQEAEPEFFTDDIIKGIILMFLVVGVDTSSTTMEWAMALLLNHPEAMEKVRAEIDIKIGQDHRLLEEQDLPKLPYLQNVINETLRLYPAVPLLAPHEASEDFVVGGYAVPRGTMVVFNAWAIHRDSDLWEDPTEFRPERFEGWSGEGAEGYKMLPFLAGRRGCPGSGLANRFIGLAIGRLVQSFKWERIGEDEVDMSEGLGLTMPRVKPLEVMCKPRPVILLA